MSQTGSVVGVWRKSSRCESQQCVEVARTATGMAVRDSADPGWHITIASPAWQAFVASVRDGELGRR
ncbi:hypothetical protein GCM10027290_42480 [Micromonospora sonneratiae]|uniref:DUF397 domain-containing protein n=1 Tax=Micromonospora sonneratiae TaxID=1184706 RepID=A0ABW3YFT2_9ACTN